MFVGEKLRPCTVYSLKASAVGLNHVTVRPELLNFDIGLQTNYIRVRQLHHLI